MAGRAAPRALREEDIRALAEPRTAATTLPSLLLTSEDPEWWALAYILRVRGGGFCIIAPAVAEVSDVSEDEMPLAPRRRFLGQSGGNFGRYPGLTGFRRPGGVLLLAFPWTTRQDVL